MTIEDKLRLIFSRAEISQYADDAIPAILGVFRDYQKSLAKNCDKLKQIGGNPKRRLIRNSTISEMTSLIRSNEHMVESVEQYELLNNRPRWVKRANGVIVSNEEYAHQDHNFSVLCGSRYCKYSE